MVHAGREPDDFKAQFGWWLPWRQALGTGGEADVAAHIHAHKRAAVAAAERYRGHGSFLRLSPALLRQVPSRCRPLLSLSHTHSLSLSLSLSLLFLARALTHSLSFSLFLWLWL